MTERDLTSRAISKARQSPCNYAISAIGLNKKGEIICTAFNKPRFMHKRGAIHAEMEVMKKAGPALKTIIIARIGNQGNLLPIHPCSMCSKKAQELGVKIVSVYTGE